MNDSRFRGIPAFDRHLEAGSYADENRRRQLIRDEIDAQGGHWSDSDDLCAVNWAEIDWHLLQAIIERFGSADDSVREHESDREMILWLQRRLFHIATRYLDMDPRSYAKEAIPSWIRHKVLARDHYRCCVCGAERHLSVDHIVPESQGGPTVLDNLRTLCRSCNSAKGNR